jgi:hypothetical protein
MRKVPVEEPIERWAVIVLLEVDKLMKQHIVDAFLRRAH